MSFRSRFQSGEKSVSNIFADFLVADLSADRQAPSK